MSEAIIASRGANGPTEPFSGVVELRIVGVSHRSALLSHPVGEGWLSDGNAQLVRLFYPGGTSTGRAVPTDRASPTTTRDAVSSQLPMRRHHVGQVIRPTPESIHGGTRRPHRLDQRLEGHHERPIPRFSHVQGLTQVPLVPMGRPHAHARAPHLQPARQTCDECARDRLFAAALTTALLLPLRAQNGRSTDHRHQPNSMPPREPLHQGQCHLPDETPHIPRPEGQPQGAFTHEIGTNPQHTLAPVFALG